MKTMERGSKNDIVVENHLGLVKYLMEHHDLRPPKGYTYEDMLQVGAIALIKAKNSYDPAKSAWGTYASRCILNEFFMLFRKEKRAAINKAVHLEATNKNAAHDSDKATYMDLMPDADDVESMFFAEEIKNMLKIDPYLYTVFVYQFLEGKSQKEIAALVGVTPSYISRVTTEIRAIAKCYIDGGDYDRMIRQVSRTRKRRKWVTTYLLEGRERVRA
jgi:RNA polymerase sporulation-specific sigma factor